MKKFWILPLFGLMIACAAPAEEAAPEAAPVEEAAPEAEAQEEAPAADASEMDSQE